MADDKPTPAAPDPAAGQRLKDEADKKAKADAKQSKAEADKKAAEAKAKAKAKPIAKTVKRVLAERSYVGERWVRKGVEVTIPADHVGGFEANGLLLPKGAKPTHLEDGTALRQVADLEAPEKR